MDRYSKHVKKVNKALPFFLIFFAVLCIAVGIFISQSRSDYKQNGIKATAEIIDFAYGFPDYDDVCAIVKFNTGEKEIAGRLDYYTASMRKGDTLTVYYMEDNPYDFVYGGSNAVLLAITFSVGGVLIAVSVAIILSSALRKSKLKKLKDEGHRKTVTVQDVLINWNVVINEMHPAKLVCKDLSGKEYVTKVKVVGSGEYNVGDKLDVYVDLDDPSKYVFDMNSLEKPSHDSPQEPFDF